MTFLSARQRKSRKFFITLIVSMSVMVILLSVLVYIEQDKKNVYTKEELIHDHDGDGIPDHDVNSH